MERKTCCTAAVTVAVAAAGCGSSGPLSRAELAKQGTAICNRELGTVRALIRHTRSFRAGVAKAIPAFTKGTQELANLKPPAELKADYASFVAYQQKRLKRIRQALAGRETPSSVAEAHAETRLARELGLEACGSG